MTTRGAGGSVSGHVPDGARDTLRGGPGADTLAGGAGGDDEVRYDDELLGVHVDLEGDPDDGAPGEADSVGTDLEDITGSDGDDELIGNAADNQIYAEEGDDRVDGGAGNDYLSGGDDADTVAGGPGDDAVSAGSSDRDVADVLDGGDGDDALIGDDGADTLSGGAGADTLEVGSGPATASGGAGNDSVRIQSDTGVTVDLDGVADDGAAGQGANVGSDIEQLIGTWYADVLTGSSGAEILEGGDGADTLNGAGGNDVLAGGLGDDALNGGDGNDLFTDVVVVGGQSMYDPPTGADAIAGGAGEDTVMYAERQHGVTVTLDGVADDGEAGEGDNVGADVEAVIGGVGDDRLVGDAAANTLVGGLGDDALAGGAGADQLDGDAGADTLDGGADNDSFDGGGGNDTLAARDGRAERIVCGGGADSVTSDAVDDAGRDCETVAAAALLTIAKSDLKPTSTGRARVKLTCASPAGCRGKLTLRTASAVTANGKKAKVTIGSAAFDIATGKTQTVPVKVGRTARAVLKRLRKVRVSATAVLTLPDGARSTVAVKVSLRAR